MPNPNELEKFHPQSSFVSTVRRLATQTGRSVFALTTEILRLRLGRGKLSLTEYLDLNLSDPIAYKGVDKSAFIGFKASQKVWLTANYRVDLFGLVNNKVASDILFSAHGFAVLPTYALFRQGVGIGGAFLLADQTQLREFLTDPQNYPLFGKPISGHQSLGSASIDHFDPKHQHMVLTTGHRLTLEDYIAYVIKYGDEGYLFQARISPHAAIREICGDRLATVRLITIIKDGTPKVLRACWKIPCGINAADNFWRPGNLLAQLDLTTGQVLRVIQGEETGFAEITHHPDSGAAMLGITVPNWQQVIETATEAAKVVADIPLAGWDIVPVDNGAIVVEINETPDFRLNQLADRRGILEPDLIDFIATRKGQRAQWFAKVKQHRQGQ